MSFVDYKTFIDNVIGITWDKNDFDWLKDKVTFQGFNPTMIAQESVNLFGEGGTARLAVVGALRGNKISSFPDISIKCGGTINGEVTLKKLMDDGHLVGCGVTDKSVKRSNKTLNLTRIASATPVAPLFAFYNWCDKHSTDATAALTRFSVSGLAPYLQFQAAAALNLGPETRKRHIEWSKQFTSAIGGTFNQRIYDAQAANYVYYKDLKAVQDIMVIAENETSKP